MIAIFGVVSSYVPLLIKPDDGPEHELKSFSHEPIALKVTSLDSSVHLAPRVIFVLSLIK